MKEKTITTIKVILGSLAVAIGIYYFWAPSDLAAGGVSGLAIVFEHFLRPLPISVIILALDSIMFLLGFLTLGAQFGLKSIISSLSIAGFMRLFEVALPISAPLSEDALVILIFGSIFIAFGQAVIFRQEASSGGTDIIAKIITKATHLPIAVSLLIADMLVVILATTTFGTEKGLYAALGVLLVTLMIDFFITGLSVEKYVMIIPSNEAASQAIVTYILETLERGATLYQAEGAYGATPKKVIATVLDRRDFILMKQYVQKEDSRAFVTVHNLHEVVGEGFKSKDI